MSEISIEDLQSWIGRSETVEETIALATVENMNATLGRRGGALSAGDALPPSWHWLFFNRGASPEDLGRDGHVANSDFAPPQPLPRRMWAGNKVDIQTPLTIGSRARRVTTIEEITEKTGHSGRLIFLRERSDLSDDQGGALTDWKTVVYREEADVTEKPKPNPAPVGALWSQDVTPDPVLLFRYSALTFNSHRIHYDRDYTTSVEGYPALLVHGPLTATLLLNLLRQKLPGAELRQINIRAMAPLFDNAPFSIYGIPAEDGKSAKLWATTLDGNLAMTVNVDLV